MPDPETPAETPAAAAATPETPPTTPAADRDGGEVFDQDRAMRTIQTQRDAEKALKAENKSLKEKADRLDALEAEKLSEQEKAAKRADEAERKAAAADAKLQRANLIAALADPDLGIVNARAAAKLIEGVEYDDDGEPTNLGTVDEEDSLIATFLSQNGFLRGTPSKPAAPTLNGGETQEKPNPNLTAAEATAAEQYGMSPEEYAVFKNGGSLKDLQAAGLKQD